MNQINISDCPFSGLKRKAWKHEFIDSDERIILTVMIGYFTTDGTEIRAGGIDRYSKPLIAVNETKVNPSTGDLIQKGETGYETAIGELDFLRSIPLNSQLIAVGNISAINEIMYSQYIHKADQRGQFNIIPE